MYICCNQVQEFLTPLEISLNALKYQLSIQGLLTTSEHLSTPESESSYIFMLLTCREYSAL